MVVKSMLQMEREITLISTGGAIPKFKISDTHSDELKNVFFFQETVALDVFNKKIAEVFNGSQV